MTEQDIQKQLGCYENAEIEFKSAKGGLPKSFWETFSAFANTNGGVIMLGVKEKEGKFIPDGLNEEQIQTYKKCFWDCAHNKKKVSATMLTERDVTEVDLGEGKVLIFRIPRASYDIRPVYLTENPFGNTYKRNHEGDYHCTDSEVRQMFSDANHTTLPFDNQILPNYTIDDIDIPSLKSYRQRFSLRKANHPWNELDDFAFMTKLGVYRVDRETGEEGFTRAGILMFGKTESITDQACTPWYFVDYQEKMSDDPKQRWTDRIYPDGTWEANLYQFFYRVYNKLAQTLPVPFLLNGITRQEETTAHIAIREGLVNTLVHCNYAVLGNIVVTRNKEWITFRNPGNMLVSVEDFYEGNQSICRNPILQKFFIQLGIGEKAGSGADFIVKGWLDNKWNKPQLEERVQPDIVTLTFQLNEVDFHNIMISGLDATANITQPADNQHTSTRQVSDKYPTSTRQVLGKYPINSIEIQELIQVLAEQQLSIKEMIAIMKLKDRENFTTNYLNPAMKEGLVAMLYPNSPKHPRQKYQLTEKGLAVYNDKNIQ